MVNTSLQNINYFQPVEHILPTPKEIAIVIRKLKNKKSPGNDSISNILLKHLPKRAILMIMYLMRASMSQSYFPKTWKIAKITPIPKRGKDLSQASNYRPICLLNSLNTMSKLLKSFY